MTLNPHEILGALALGGVTAVTPVSGGYDTAIWRVEAEGKAYALRVFRPEQRGVCQVESAAMQAAGAAGLPVPAVHTVTEWQERPVMLMTWSRGRPLLQEVMRRPWQAWAMAKAFGQAQARLHRVAAPARMQERRNDWWNWSGGCGDEAVEGRALALSRGVQQLIHLDYHPLNVLMEGAEVTAVIDWTNAFAGDPRADVARTMAILKFAPIKGGLLFDVARRILAAGWWRGYVQEAGEPVDMPAFHAWAGLTLYKDLAWKVGKPGVPWTEADLAPARAWAERWKQQIA